MNQNIKVGICTASYNSGKFFKDYLNSLLSQTMKPLYIVYCDDNSTDDSVDIIKSELPNSGFEQKTLGFLDDRKSLWQSNGINFMLIQRQSNGGPAAARNDCLKYLKDKVDIVGLLDADDYYKPNKIKKCVEILLTHPNVGLVYSDYDVLNNEGVLTREFKSAYSFNLLMQECIVSTNSFFPIKIIDLIGGYDEDPELKYIEDYYFWKKISTVSVIYAIPESLFVYRIHGQNGTVVTPMETLNKRHMVMNQKFQNWINQRNGR